MVKSTRLEKLSHREALSHSEGWDEAAGLGNKTSPALS